MDYYLERLKSELKKTLDFWVQHLISTEQAELFFECDHNGVPNKNALMGSMFLSRVIYGASTACRFLGNNEYKNLADIAFKMLYEQFRNPAGGFYWAKTRSNEIVHDSENINMGQAFILYGLSEYSLLTNNPIIEAEIRKQHQFILNTIRDNKNGGYLDGFNADWKQENIFTKSLGTHLHLLEAFVNIYKCTGDNLLIPLINELVDILYEKFVDRKSLECYHQLSEDWNKHPNKNWAGHNAEVSWILFQAVRSIENENKVKEISNLAVNMTRKMLEQAFDKDYGGIFNAISDGRAMLKNKEWWPQAEAAIACFNAYQISKEKVFLSYGLRLVEYIENTFSNMSEGEWYSVVTREGRPITDAPKVHFWKSLYHNIRYFIEVSVKIKEITKIHSVF